MYLQNAVDRLALIMDCRVSGERLVYPEPFAGMCVLNCI
jgi:hypothetical protein